MVLTLFKAIFQLVDTSKILLWSYELFLYRRFVRVSDEEKEELDEIDPKKSGKFV